MKANKISMKMAIIATAVVVILIGIIYFAYSLNKNFEKTVISQTQRELLAVAQAIETSLTEFFEKHSAILTVVSKNPLVQKGVYEKRGCADIGTRFCPIKNIYEANKNDVDALTLLDRNGIMLHREPYIKDRIGLDHTEKPSIAYIIKEHKPYISDIFYNNSGNLSVSISEPIFYKDEFAGIVRWMIETDTIAKRFIEPIKIGNKGFIWMFDNANTVLSHPKKDFIGMSVLDLVRKLHEKKDQVFDESQIQEHIHEKHDYINRVKVEKEGAGVFMGCSANEKNIVVYKRFQQGNAVLNLILILPYSEIIGPIHKHAAETFGLTGFVMIIFGAGGLVLFKSQKEKARLETEAMYLKQISNGAEALRKSEERFRKFVEGTDDLVTQVDRNGRLTYVNDTSEKIFGLSPEECIGLSAFDFIHPDDREKTKAAFAEWVSERVSSIFFENRQVSQDGKIHYMHWTINQDFDEDGNMIAINSIARDLTELKQIEEELKREKDRFERYINIAGVMLLAINADQEVILVNQKGCEILGYSREEIIGKNWFDNFLPKRHIKEVKEVFNKLVAGRVEPVEYHENSVLTKTGEERVVAWRNAVLFDERGQFIYTVASGEDITDRKREEEERKKLEAYLQQSMKMKAIATLAGGIAHEFNNALAGTSGNIELLQMHLPDDKNLDKYAKRMMDSVHRMADLTTQLLAYARGGKYQPKILSLNDLVKDTLPVIQHNIAPTIQVETDLSADIFSVKVDPTQMQMVLSAVLTNASEAMEDKGRIRIITRNEEVDEVFAKINPDLKPGFYVCLTIDDEGKGMDKETADKVFEPFFTTKFPGRGLGMAAAHGIIKNHGGSISLYSELGKGTVVRIYLPAMEAQAEQAKETEIKAITGTETILVIEDEEFVIDIIYQSLKELGYRILLAKTGSEAVDIAKTFDGDIDLAILDIVLPDTDGNKLYPLIMKARPNLKVIVCSGYAIDGPAQEILEAGAQDFIQKPFLLETLSEKLRKVLTATT